MQMDIKIPIFENLMKYLGLNAIIKIKNGRNAKQKNICLEKWIALMENKLTSPIKIIDKKTNTAPLLIFFKLLKWKSFLDELFSPLFKVPLAIKILFFCL